MCRILSYLGKPLLVEGLLYQPDNSFIKQSYHPIYMPQLLNLAGFGMIAWDMFSHHPQLPFIYKTTHLPFYDNNLLNLAKKVEASCLLAHLRGVSYSVKQIVSEQNVHPFIFSDMPSCLAFAHNGVLIDFEKMKYDLLDYIPEDLYKHIHGTTDSEWIFALFLAQLKQHTQPLTVDEFRQAILETLKILKKIREKLHITINSPVNLFITDGTSIAATRFVFDYGWRTFEQEASAHFHYHSLWYTYGEGYGYYDDEYKMKESEKKSSIIIASEPLTEDTTTWIEVPEYTLLVARLEKDEIKIVSQDIRF